MAKNGSNGRISGSVSSVVGPVVDFSFTGANLPEIYDAVYVDLDDGTTLVCEVQQHLGEGAVRAVAMSSTDGMRRGMEGYSNGAPITVPVGPGTLGRIFDVAGNTIDSDETVDAADHYSIHREPPAFSERQHTSRVVRDRCQGDRPDRPLHQGGQDRHLRWGRRRQDGHHPGADSITSQSITAATQSLPVWANGAAKATTSGTRCATPVLSRTRSWSSAK